MVVQGIADGGHGVFETGGAIKEDNAFATGDSAAFQFFEIGGIGCGTFRAE